MTTCFLGLLSKVLETTPPSCYVESDTQKSTKTPDS